MKIAITGSSGQLGFDLIRVLGSGNELFPFSKKDLNVADCDKVIQTFELIRPDVIVHAAACTHVDRAEAERELTYQVNAIGSRNVAVGAQKVGAKLIYISTGYVFDGKKAEPYDEFDQPSPVGVYGASKLAGERYVQMFCDRFFIVRTSWMYGIQGSNFVTKIVSRVLDGQQIYVVDDKFGSPTYSNDLARFIRQLMTTEKYGLYHAANEGGCSRYEFAKAILQAANITGIEVIAVRSDHFQLSAERPDNSVLDSMAIRLNQLPPLRDWRDALQSFFADDFTPSFFKNPKRESPVDPGRGN
ncbi:dTDP-4-dehydrorhamnose reductase [Brevibacillus sp. B_LB10_24]|uniref:dTDP-4-dehydrorhamnose reductase n=1 Tax=Brevibacillus sp. B_LB10_24 TaxID=3380645 RepID=UPI0038B98DAB